MVWLSSEVMFFGGLFARITLRSTSPTLWEENTALLDPVLATINTVILVISSFTAQWGVKAAVQLRPRRTSNKLKDWGVVEWFIVSFILGSIFLSVQSYEYAVLVSHGVTVAAHAYGSAFYITTGFHALHVLGGLVAFLFVIGRAYLAQRFGNHESTIAIVVSYYWQFVDGMGRLWFIIYVIQ